jgi:hypothetical protein
MIGSVPEKVWQTAQCEAISCRENAHHDNLETATHELHLCQLAFDHPHHYHLFGDAARLGALDERGVQQRGHVELRQTFVCLTEDRQRVGELLGPRIRQ